MTCTFANRLNIVKCRRMPCSRACFMAGAFDIASTRLKTIDAGKHHIMPFVREFAV